VQWFDRTPAIVLAILIVILGLQPSWMVRWSESTTTALFVTRSMSYQIPSFASRSDTVLRSTNNDQYHLKSFIL
jgi:hypothetical protein